MLEAGVTTVIGCLGTDGLTRNLESVLMKTKALRQEGVSAWMLTGAYQVPTPSLLGDVGRDIALIEEVIGVGEIAISDHRSSNPGNDELAKLAGHARVGGMLGNKAGIVNIHMGDALDPFRPIYDVVESSELGFKQFYPTHCNRNEHIFEDAKLYGKLGYIDITASAYPFFPDLEIKPSKAIKGFLDEGVPLQHITMTSDGCGSLPHFDEQGQLVQLEMGFPLSVYEEFKAAVQEEKIPMEKVLRIVSTNAADILKLPGKGRIETGLDADLLLLDKDLNIIHLFANGTLMLYNKEIIAQNTYH
jgi:beta-aspartyl-dipeptidase (metallo-type)